MFRILFAQRARLIDRLDLTGADEAFHRKQTAKGKAVPDAIAPETTLQLERKEKA